MFKGSIFLFAIAVSLPALSQTPSTSPVQSSSKPDEKQAEPCTVSGRVLSATENAPIKSARVMLVQENAKSPAIFGAITDSEGRFQIKRVPPGRYRFSARRVGFVGQQYQAKGASQGAILLLTAPTGGKRYSFPLNARRL